MNRNHPTTRGRFRRTANPWSVRLALTLLVLIIGCSSPSDADPEPDPDLTLEVEQTSQEQGIHSPVWIGVTVLDDDGDPVPDVEVRWSAREGLVGEWFLGSRDRDFDLGTEATEVTREDGTAGLYWMMGPHLGEHTMEISAPGAAPIERSATALPGVVLVGVWTLPDWFQEQLPSDTIRLHATNYHVLSETFQRFEEGVEMVIFGDILRGPGVDSTWVFRLHPASIRTPRWPVGHTGQCIGPPLSEADLDEFMGSLVSRRLCPNLRLVDIEDYSG